MQQKSIQNLAMVPVRGTVYIVKLPFVCVWRVLFFLYSCVYAVVLSVLSVPVNIVKRVYHRVMTTWNWTKVSVKQSLGFRSKTPVAAITDGTQALQPRDYLSDPVSGHPSHLALRDNEGPFLHTHCGPHQRPSRRKRSRHERKAMITHLLRLLLEPSSPVESEDESERASSTRSAGPEQDEAEKALNLILDLVKLSKSGTQEPVGGGKKSAATLKPEDLESLLRQARDRDQLQALITELDQLAIEVDPDKMLKKSGGSSGHPSPSHLVVDPERPSSSSSIEPLYTPNPGSTVSSSDEGLDPNDDDDDQFHDVEEHPTSFERPMYKHRTLSPVRESPEDLTASAESLKLNQLEDELTKALSNLTTATSGLTADQELVESMETEITQKTVTVTETPARDNDLESVPKTAPSLGVQVGHERRDLAIARKSRPPSRRPGHTQSQDTDHKPDNTRGDLDSESSESDDEPNEAAKEKQKSGGRVLPKLPLTDQIQLLTSGSPVGARPDLADEDDTEDASLSQTDGPKGHCSDPGDVVKETQRSKHESTSSDPGDLKITSSQPLWKEMRTKRTSSSSSPATTPTSANASLHPVLVYTPPIRKNRAQSDPQQPGRRKEDSIWDTDPALDNRDGLYDTLTPKSQAGAAQTQPVYLHERIALRNGASSTEPSPMLPPRNNLALKRTASAETVSRPQQERPLQRRGSERQSSTRSHDKESQEKSREGDRSSDKEHKERSRESSKEHRERSRDGSKEHRDRSRDSSKEHRERSREKGRSGDRGDQRDESTRESRSKDTETRQSRSREKERHRHRSPSPKRTSSRHEHRHSSDCHHHRSRSGDRSSNERHSSSHRHGSSHRHRSHSAERSHSRSERHRHRSRSGDQSSNERHSSSHRHGSSHRHRSHSAERSHSRSERHRHRSRSGDQSSNERHSSSHRHGSSHRRSRSPERSGSRKHSHSSDHHHHRSRSGNRSSSHSTDRHSSSHSSSDRHRSHSSHRNHSSTPSPDSKSSTEGQAKSKASANPSAKSRIAALFSRSSAKDSSSKDKEEKQKKASPTDRERKSRSATSKSRSNKFRASDKTSDRTSRHGGSSSSPDKETPGAGKVVYSASMTSLKSADVSSVYSFDSAITGKNTDV